MHQSSTRFFVIILFTATLSSVISAALINAFGVNASAVVPLSALGLAISVYVALYQYRKIAILCPRNRIIDCRKVLDSKYSYFIGVRMSLVGALFFIAELIFNQFAYVYMAPLNVLGVLFVIERAHSQSEVGRICIYCTLEYVIIVLLLLISLH